MQDDNDKSRGFGFVNFEDVNAAHSAVDALNGKDIDGQALYAGRAQKKSERESELKARYKPHFYPETFDSASLAIVHLLSALQGHTWRLQMSPDVMLAGRLADAGSCVPGAC